jgi:predicted RNA methylase
MTRIDYTVTVDDYTLDPPTEAAFMATIDLSDDGITWKTVVSMWAGISCIHVGSIAIGGKKVRVTAQTQGIASVISLHAEAF